MSAVSCGSDSSPSSQEKNVEDSEPKAFSFTTVSDAPLNTLITSSEITVADINVATTVSVEGGEYSINNGEFSNQSSKVSAGDKLVLRLLSSDQYSTTKEATITIGGVTGRFLVTTLAAPPSNSVDDFTFYEKKLAEPNTLINSNIVTLSGLTQAATVSLSAGELSINGAAFTNQPGIVDNGDTLQIRLLSSAELGKSTESIVTIADKSSNYIVSTVIGKFSWTSPIKIPGFTQSIQYDRVTPDMHGGAWIAVFVASKLGATDGNIYAMNYNSVDGLSQPIAIDDSNSSTDLSAITTDSKGNVLVIWRHGYEYFARSYSVESNAWGDIYPFQQRPTSILSVLYNIIVHNDTFFALGYESDATTGSFYLHSYNVTGGWEPVETVVEDTGIEFLYNAFSLSDSGTPILIYKKSTLINSELVSKVRDMQTGQWLTDSLATAGPDALFTELTIDSDSVGFVLFYNIYDAGIVQKYIQSRTAENSWVSSKMDYFFKYFQNNGNFIFLYSIDDNGTERIVSKNYSRSSGFSSAQNIIAKTPNVCYVNSKPSAQMKKNRYGKIALLVSFCGHDGVWSARYQSGEWTAINRLDKEPVYTDPRYKIITDQNDRFFGLWETAIHSAAGYLASATMDTEGDWSEEQLLETSNSGLSSYVNAVQNMDGIHVIWQKKPHSAAGNFMTTRFATGIGWETEQPIIAPNALYPSTYNIPDLVPLASGKMFSITYWYDGIKSDAYIAEYK